MNRLAQLQSVPVSDADKSRLRDLSSQLVSDKQLDAFNGSDPTYLPSQTYDNIDPIPNGYCTIINYITQAEAKAGFYGHWVCIDNRDPVYIKYIDPYGLEPDVGRAILHLQNTGNFTKKLQSSNKPIMINHEQYQDLISYDDSCGVWSSIFVQHPWSETDPFYANPTPSGVQDLGIEQRFLQLMSSQYSNAQSASAHFTEAPQYQYEGQESGGNLAQVDQLLSERGDWRVGHVKTAHSALPSFVTHIARRLAVRAGLQPLDKYTHAYMNVMLHHPTDNRIYEWIKLDKLSTPRVTRFVRSDIPASHLRATDIRIEEPIKLSDFIERGKIASCDRGSAYGAYSLRDSNCQHFVRDHLVGSNLPVPDDLDEGSRTLLKDSVLAPLSNFATDLGARLLPASEDTSVKLTRRPYFDTAVESM